MFRTLCYTDVNFIYSNHSINQDSAHLIWQKFDLKHALASEWSSCLRVTGTESSFMMQCKNKH